MRPIGSLVMAAMAVVLAVLHWRARQFGWFGADMLLVGANIGAYFYGRLLWRSNETIRLYEETCERWEQVWKENTNGPR